MHLLYLLVHQNSESSSSSSSAQNPVSFVGTLNPKKKRIGADSLRLQHPEENQQQAILNSFQSEMDSPIEENSFVQNILQHSKEKKLSKLGDILLEKSQVKSAFDKLKKLPKKQQVIEGKKDSIESSGAGGSSASGGGGASKGKGKKGDDKKDDKKDDDKSGGKTLTKEEVREERANQAQARLEQQEEDRIKHLDVQNRVTEYQTLIPKLNHYTSDRQLDKEDWATYRALMKFHKIATGNIPKASTAVTKLQEKLAESIKSLEGSVKQHKLQHLQEDQTITGNKLNFTSDLRGVLSSSKTPRTPVNKVKESEKRPQSPSETNRKSIEGMISHNNPQTGKNN